MFLARMLLIVAIVVASLFTGPSSVTAQSDRESEQAIERAIQLSQYEEAGDTRSLYRSMHPDSKAVVPFSAMDGWYTNEFFPLVPHAITTIVSVEFVTWTWGVTGQTYDNTAEITFIQPFGVSGRTTDSQETVRLVKDGVSWKWFFGRSGEFVEDQILKYPEKQESSQTVTRVPRSGTKLKSSSGRNNVTSVPGVLSDSVPQNCTLVELYPGYPLYRGNITGVMSHWDGLGDFQCLEDLEQGFPRFDKAREDKENKSAARTLGIDGDPHQWTWENWLQIESQRGLQPSCYSCLIIDQSYTPIMTNIQPDSQDARIRIGFFGEESSLSRIIKEHGFDGGMWSLLDFLDHEAYELRAIAYSYDTSANADEILSLYGEIFTFLVSAAGDDKPSPPIYTGGVSNYTNWILWEAGGYTVVPANSHPGDQVFLLSVAVFAIDNWSTDTGDNYLHGQLDRGVQAWISLGYPDSLAAFLRGKGYFSG